MKKLALAVLVVGYAASAASPVEAQDGGNESAARVQRICASAPDKSSHDAKFVDALAKELLLSPAQQAAYKDFQETRDKTVEAARSRLCANKPDLSTFEGRLALHLTFLQDRVDTVKAENPKLIAFYNGLNAEQKAKFERIREKLTEGPRR